MPGVWHSAKLEKNAAKTATRSILPSATAWHSAKRSILPSARWYHSAKTIFKKIFLKKNCFFAECSALALGKHSNFAECQSLGTRQSRRQMLTAVIFCRVRAWHSAKALPSVDFWHSAKKFLPTKSLPRGRCRVRHSAKPLPSACLALPSAPSTRQRGRLQLCFN